MSAFLLAGSFAPSYPLADRRSLRAALPDSLLPQYPTRPTLGFASSAFIAPSGAGFGSCSKPRLLPGGRPATPIPLPLARCSAKIEVGTSATAKLVPAFLLHYSKPSSTQLQSGRTRGSESATPLLQIVRFASSTAAASASLTPEESRRLPPSVNLPAGTSFPILRLVVLFLLEKWRAACPASDSLCKGELRLFTSLFACLRPGDIVLVIVPTASTSWPLLLKNIGRRSHRNGASTFPKGRLSPHQKASRASRCAF